MEYFLNAGNFGSVFAVPKSIVDNYIKLANEASIKVLLYMLRNNEQEHSCKTISDALNISENQVEEAFVFWENANIFMKKGNISTTEFEKKQNVVKEEPKTEIHKPAKRNYNINPSEIAERVENSEEIKCLFLMSEEAFGRPLTHTEQSIFIWIHDYLGLSTDVILMLTAYCISIEKGSIKYIETIAADWSDREINNLEAAQNEIKRLEEYSGFNRKIMKIFGMNRKPTSKQQEYIDAWKGKNYNIELIEYAYEKTIESIDKLNFPYINKILENWYQSGLLTKAQIDNANFKRNNNNSDTGKKSYSFDINEIKSLTNNFGE